MKPAAEKFQGVSAFIVTPTKDDGEALDLAALKRFIDFQIDSGVDGITVFGSTGGIGSFSEQERQQVIETAARHINGRVVLTAGTGSIQTAEAIRLSKFAADAGADGVLVVPISYWPLTDDELYGHFEGIANAVNIPVGIYNNPGTTGIDMKPALIARIAEIDNVGFVKESSGDVTRISAIAHKTKGSISILNGNDAGTPAAIAAGVHGWFAGSCSIMPKLCTNLFALRKADKGMEKLRQAFANMYPICEFMGLKGYIRVAYAACDILGHSMGAPRKPIRSLDKADRLILERLLADAGVTVSVAAA
ncbi:dihydrodipicolinate synthase family protein [Bradyrhizobium sp. Arg237L]|uniref:dihydrodipicolinate synthase family protein n=1 Tax=Bradyrhizobium sp. Arg237L TaxID=3003352 RepID=UPI00249E5A1C|nr:dihydrodipicolinate synthase family protein [Bradyrhizobium sp. Arg237L]MDI4239000.1 dihydrodipicolinate synthase family protein [Bradyrhizobium sp. Arg237L]